ncbi:MAG TPA: hypothetical protein PKL77_10010 [Candidatus Omnitrophota bacterium]|nr:hypothetical protein [Candidatus Omnitrophota bacterium]HNX82464.1 hypothetical protein [Candidatus Omnitrophota bacterium]
MPDRVKKFIFVRGRQIPVFMGVWGIYFLLAFFGGQPVFAEMILFKDGSFISGDIVLETDDIIRVTEKAGDAIVENDYNLTDVKRIGERDIEEERSDPSRAKKQTPIEVQPSLQVMEDDPEYDRMIVQIAETIPALHAKWHVDHFDYEGFRNWFVLFNELRDTFKQKFSTSKRISCTYANLLFVHVDNFKTAFNNMEQIDRLKQEKIKKNVTQRVISCLTETLQQYESSADEALDGAVKYSQMAQERLAR